MNALVYDGNLEGTYRQATGEEQDVIDVFKAAIKYITRIPSEKEPETENFFADRFREVKNEEIISHAHVVIDRVTGVIR